MNRMILSSNVDIKSVPETVNNISYLDRSNKKNVTPRQPDKFTLKTLRDDFFFNH